MERGIGSFAGVINTRETNQREYDDRMCSIKQVIPQVTERT